MTTNAVLTEMAEKWLPFPVEEFFTMQRAPDQWFGDELPPTLQDDLRSPLVTQSKAMVQFQLLQQLAMEERREMMERGQRRYAVARGKVGGKKRK